MPYQVSARAANFALLLLFAVSTPAFAAFHARIGAQSWATRQGLIARVTVNDQPFATLRTPAGGLNPAQRAAGVKHRLIALVTAGLSPSEISVAAAGGQSWEIRGRGGAILLVTAREAATQGQAARVLAFAWAKNLKARLADPPLTLSARQILVPDGTTRIVAIGGAAPVLDIAVTGGDSRVGQARLVPGRRLLLLTGVGAGQMQVRVQAEGASLPLTVYVQHYAAQIQPRVTIRVTGRPVAPASLVQEAVYLGLKRVMTAEEGAQMRLLQLPRPVKALSPGQSESQRLLLRVAGSGLLPVEAAPLVTVMNQPLPPASAAALFYSNNPEQIREGRTLFTGTLALRQPVRLDYHHQNRGLASLIFHADIVNGSDQRASVHVMGGVALPEVDTVQVGRRAGAAFLQALDGGVGLVMDVPPHARIPLVVQRFAPGLTVSGILQVQQLTGRDRALSFSVAADGDRLALAASPARFALAETSGPHLAAMPAASEASGAARQSSPFVFGPPRVALAGTYAVGGQWQHLRLGNAESLRNADGSRTLWGNYGVSYFVTLTLSNPTRAPHVVGIFFAPEAGLAAGVFQVSGQPVLQFDPLPPPEEKLLCKLRLEPGGSRRVHLRTILLNGSAYPASVVVHAL